MYPPSPPPKRPAGGPLRFPAPASPTRPPWLRALSIAGTVVAVGLTFMAGMISSSYALPPDGDDPSVGWVVSALVWWFLVLAVATTVVWRDRYAVAVCVTTAVVGILTPVGAVAPLLALPFVVARESRSRILGCVAVTGVAVATSLWRDEARGGETVVFSIPRTTETAYLSPLGYVLFGVLFMAVSIGAGFLRRAVATADAAQVFAHVESRRADELQSTTDVLQSQTDQLRTELSRQDERELIAREMHDTVAHNLSVVSLQASALEVTTEDADVAEAARTMRSSAHRALDEMRGLITSLRAGAEHYTGSAPSLGDLARLLDDARASGVDLAATVFITNGEDAPPALTRATYRVVQESLTNVMKHAPGACAEVDVRARPGDGVRVRVANAWVTDASPAPQQPGSGAGIVGMRERCTAIGGTFDAGLVGQQFVVNAHLPWALPQA